MNREQKSTEDVVFSNSVIEHVGSFAQQRRMADEIQQVGRRYFVQTPKRLSKNNIVEFFKKHGHVVR